MTMDKLRKIIRMQKQRRQQGVAAIEFALVLVILLLIIGGIFEFGRVFWYYNALAKATRDGARLMSLSNSLTLSSEGIPAVRNLVASVANDARVSPPLMGNDNVVAECLDESFSPVTCTDNSAPANVRVSIADYTVTIGGWMPLFTTVGGTVSYTVSVAPQTTMRYWP